MTPEEAKIYVDKLKELYPNPMPAPIAATAYYDKDKYCVGGAFCRRVLCDPNYDGFPDDSGLGHALGDINHTLDMTEAENLAGNIVAANDACNIGIAWQKLEEALCYKGTYHDKGRSK